MKMAYESEDGVQPPSTVTVEREHKPRLYLADGTPLVRQAGFMVMPHRYAVVRPDFQVRIQAMKKRGGKRKS